MSDLEDLKGSDVLGNMEGKGVRWGCADLRTWNQEYGGDSCDTYSSRDYVWKGERLDCQGQSGTGKNVTLDYC